ncbi:barstar (barnase inhibitor) [Halopolyspora algeriensis]|uniref:Barstar (Barnase inhibitor) n=1 Tax=Halopolyspora algeriensis TaxID=1500506 RepID=A0A368VKK4_9ACTN|nr:barstar family protein [Halopolyspora algeriensis]RCW40817.1 barstar (barnase inhibitor) [Halopolyspora algeriensis]TQM53266.1 barstar (barnase inhibitor) [Halopolyspora algeriensis]
MGGPEQPSATVTARQAVEEARDRGAVPHVLDGAELVNKRTALCGIAAVLSFPEWACRDLDGLYDCLTDLSWLSEGEHVLVWTDPQVLAEHDPRTYRSISAVLRDATDDMASDRDFSAVLTRD